jgi:predicted phage terminase large subunit-like protein
VPQAVCRIVLAGMVSVGSFQRRSFRLAGLLAGIDARGISASGDKLTRAKGLAAQAYAGNVMLVRGPWNEMFLEHMHHQPGWPHDDIMDGASGAFNDLTDAVGGTKTSKAKVHKIDKVFGG